MEARIACAALIAASFLSLGASYRTQNFLVTAPTPQFAKQVGDTAETMRRELAIEWLEHELPPWSEPCPIQVQVGNMGAGGVTSFMFDRGRPFGWQMAIQGTPERVLDSVLPHEITHTIFATHFGRPLPRWADEGACTTVEHDAEKQKQHKMLIQFLTTNRGIAFNQMFAMSEYPADIMPLYSQGFSLARYLIAQGGKPKFVDYVGDGMRRNNWTAATREHYGFESLSELQVEWLEWVRQGSPPVDSKTTLVAQHDDESLVRPASYQKSDATRFAATRTAGSWYARVRDGDAGTDETIAKTMNQAEIESDISDSQVKASSRPNPAIVEPVARISSRDSATEPRREVLMEWGEPVRHAAGLVPLPAYQPPPSPKPSVGHYGPPTTFMR